MKPYYSEKLREFVKKFSKKGAIVITKKQGGLKKFPEGTIKMIPAWKWLLEN